MPSPNPSKYNYSDKVVLVTGSSTGLGEEMALRFAQYGAKVVITGRNSENLSKVTKRIEQSSGTAPLEIIGDFLTEQDLPEKLILQTIRTFGRLDILVNNAGWATKNGNLSSTNLLEEYDNVFNLNVRSVVALTQLAVPYLEVTKGNVINISSCLSIKPWQLCYSASKAALDMITKTCALELGPKGIRVNSINPGPIATDIFRSMGVLPEQKEQFYADLIERSLMKRLGTEEDVANLPLFLGPDDARNITGSIHLTDGGLLVL